MVELVTKRYCDLPHDTPVENAESYKNILVILPDGAKVYRTVDMCSECYNHYSSNLYASFDVQRNIVYSFQEPNTASIGEVQTIIDGYVPSDANADTVFQ